MEPNLSEDEKPASSKLLSWALAGVVLAASVARGRILFSTPLMPGMNGAYYLVQARSLLTHGALGIPDLPLTFCLQAALAWVIQLLTHRDLESSIVLAVKISDSVLPALIAVPVFALVRRWGRVAGAPIWIALAAAALATLNAPALSMVGDFEKNSLGLVWLAALLLSIHIWLNHPTPRYAVGVVSFWGLAGLTHIAVFGASLLFGGLAILFYFAGHRGRTWRVLWPLLASASAVCALAAVLVLWKFDAHRVMRLENALAHPSDFLSGNNPPGGQPGGPQPGGPGPMGPMPGFGQGFFSLIFYLPFLLFALLAIAALVVSWRRRGMLPPGEFCVVGACAVGVLVMTGPWVHGDKSFRFYLIAIMPALLAGAFAVQYWQRPRLRAAVIALFMLGMIGPSLMLLVHGGQPIANEEEVSELRSMAPLIKNPERTLIVARHGLEWWTAWTLHTHIVHGNALQTNDWQNFDSVYFLHSKHMQFPMMMAGRRPHDPQQGQQGSPPLGSLFPPGPPPGIGAPPGGMGNPMAEPEIPTDSKTVHDGEYFMLALVTAPPSFVSNQTPSQVKVEGRK